jgi:hypothetical protein
MKELRDMPEERSGGKKVFADNRFFRNIDECMEEWDCEGVFKGVYAVAYDATYARNIVSQDKYIKAIFDWFENNPQPIYCTHMVHKSLDLQDYIYNEVDNFFADNITEDDEIGISFSDEMNQAIKVVESFVRENCCVCKQRDVRVSSDELAEVFLRDHPFQNLQKAMKPE